MHRSAVQPPERKHRRVSGEKKKKKCFQKRETSSETPVATLKMETLKLHSDGRKRLRTSLQLLVLKLMEQQVITTSTSEHLLLVKHLAEWNTVNTTSMVLWKQMYAKKKFSFIYVFYIMHVLSCFVILFFQFSTINCTEMLQIKVCWGWEACFHLQKKKLHFSLC